MDIWKHICRNKMTNTDYISIDFDSNSLPLYPNQKKPMEFNEFVRNRKNCYVAENGFLFWKISYDGNRELFLLDGGGSNIIVHAIVFEGEMAVRSGDKQYMLAKNSFATFLEQPSFELLSISGNIKAYLIFLKDSYTEELLRYNPPFPISYVMKIRKSPVEIMKWDILRQFSYRLDSMENVCMDESHVFRNEMIRYSLWMFFMDIANVHIRQEEQKKAGGQTERKKELFMRFMQLLSSHVVREHTVGFYASKLCVTRQYLNRISRLNSDKTAYEWICFALTGEITKRLETTDESMLQISEHFYFPDQASLTKFYKHQTGYSPTEYKKKLVSK